MKEKRKEKKICKTHNRYIYILYIFLIIMFVHIYNWINKNCFKQHLFSPHPPPPPPPFLKLSGSVAESTCFLNYLSMQLSLFTIQLRQHPLIDCLRQTSPLLSLTCFKQFLGEWGGGGGKTTINVINVRENVFFRGRLVGTMGMWVHVYAPHPRNKH